MDNTIRQLVQNIHDTPGRVMIVSAGAGIQAMTWLLGVAGASRTLLEALILYDESSFDSFLDQKPQQYVAIETAGYLAGRAVKRARHLWQGSEPVIGLACTATIITDRPKLGDHRAHIVAWSQSKISHYSLYLDKGARDRHGEEDLVSRLMLNALAEAYGLDIRVPFSLSARDELEVVEDDLAGAVKDLLSGKSDYFAVNPDGHKVNSITPKAMLSGSFYPLHEGHLALANVASEILGCEIVFELAAINVEKPTIDQLSVLERLLQFAGRYPVIISNAATFLAKSLLFPGTTFVIGHDTAQRILEPRFYGHSQDHMLAALQQIESQDCHFLIAGRLGEDGEFHNAAELAVPDAYHHLFRAIPDNRFRLDISSSDIRARSTSR
jgi:nicotinic acid mononucleotide adenylyltransferase